MAKTKNKKDLMDDLMTLGIGLLGGIAANQVSNIVEKQEFIQGHEEYVPAIPASIGALIYIMTPKDNGKNKKLYDAIRSFGFGSFVVGGTEGAETLIAKTTGAVAGNGAFIKQLGFTPQYLPGQMQKGVVRTAGGVVVR
jgi:hypothetical protein